MARRYTGGLLSSKEQVTDANSASGIFSVQEAGALTAAGSFPTGRWTPQRSLRFRSATGSYLNKSFGADGNRKTWTMSWWVKRGKIGSDQHLWSSAGPNHPGGADIAYIGFTGDDRFVTYMYPNGGPATYYVGTNRVFRDPSAWYHIVLHMDTSLAIQTNRIKIYVNGVQETSLQNTSYPSTDYASSYINSTRPQIIGQEDGRWRYGFEGYMSEFNFIDGQALDASNFGYTDPSTGAWVPKQYTGTYGTNGFYLDFRDNTSTTNLALDRSGNGNNWTPNSISVSGATATTVSFTSVGTTSWTVPPGITSVNYLVVAGGGAGGSAGPTMYDGGAAGGGAGGMLYGTMAVTPGTVYSIYVGAGATGAANRTRGASGDNSVLSSSSTSITAIGGGGGGGGANTTSGANGGSGGGGANGGAAGLGTAGQGNNGGYYGGSPGNGGGGAGGVGGSATSNTGANGGAGLQWPVNSTTYAGGGGGGGYQLGGGSGGSSIGGNGGSNNSNGSSASASTGSGGGGSGGTYNTTGTLTGGSGANGIIIVSYATIDSTYDSMVDVPGIAAVTSQPDWGGVQRGNYPVLSPVSVYNGGGTLSNGNLSVSYSDTANNKPTMGAISGKWYTEITCTSSGGYSGTGLSVAVTSTSFEQAFINAWYYSNGQTYNYGTDSYISYGATWGTGDIIGVAWDCDNGNVTFYKNGVSQGLLTANREVRIVPTSTVGSAPYPTAYGTGVTSTFTINYGQRPFAYFPPAGFKSLCSTNLPNPVIKRPSDHFDVKTYTGNGVSLQVGTTPKQISTFASSGLRFRREQNTYLSRTPASAGNRRTWTYSAWIKRANLATYQRLLTATVASGDEHLLFREDTADVFNYYSGGAGINLQTNRVFKDTANWTNIILAVDTTNSASSERVKLYFDGVRVTSFSTATYPALNADTGINSVIPHGIGGADFSQYFDGSMSEINFIDGQQLTPSSFGVFDANNNWMPQRYTGTYGTNGFYLPLSKPTDTPVMSFGAGFNGSTAWLSTANNAALNLGSSDFTAEAWVYNTGSTVRNSSVVFNKSIGGAASDSSYYFGLASNGMSLYLSTSGTAWTHGLEGECYPIGWSHCVWQRRSNVLELYFNGKLLNTASTTGGTPAFSGTVFSSTRDLEIGRQSTSGSYFSGWISNARLVVGSAVYAGNFTPPTSALTAITNTRFLTLQNSTFIDNSTNAFSITNNNVDTPIDVSPWQRTVGYDASGSNNNWYPVNFDYSVPRSTVLTYGTPGTYTWVAPAGVTSVKALVIAGGGAGGSNGGGGGAGGMIYNAAVAVTPGNSYTVTVGRGGYTRNQGNATNSVFSSLTAIAGGNGATYGVVGAQNGGSGGGGTLGNNTPGTGTAGQGNAGGAGNNGNSGNTYYHGGGGGAGSAGTAGGSGGAGGAGLVNSITGIPIYYAGGGGGHYFSTNTPVYAAGGIGGGGTGQNSKSGPAAGGRPNSGGGGGGTSAGLGGGPGGSGVVILSYTNAASYVGDGANSIVASNAVKNAPTDFEDSTGVSGNYAILDYANYPISNSNSGNTYNITNAGLTLMSDSSGAHKIVPATMPVSSGKWYFEMILESNAADAYSAMGLIPWPLPNHDYLTNLPSSTSTTNGFSWQSGTTNSFTFWTDYIGGAARYVTVNPISAAAIGDVMQIAIDIDNNKIWAGRNNVWYDASGGSTGNPSTGANPTSTNVTRYIGQYGALIPFCSVGQENMITANFGQSGFMYTPPTGFKAINSKNLKDVGSTNLPDTFGNFVNTPDLVWIKNRTSASGGGLFNTVIGPTRFLQTSNNNGLATTSGELETFLPNGFLLGANGNITNNSGNSYVGWAWNRGKTPGFDIVTYAGNGVNGRMIPHNLGQVPAFYITKCLTSYNSSQGFLDWNVWHKDVDVSAYGGSKTLYLMQTTNAGAAGGYFANPTSSEFSPNQINYDNSSGQSYIAYLWAEVPGFSKMGSYTGNNSTNGPFVYTGFRPRWVMVKNRTSAQSWQLMDSARSTFNPATSNILPNSTIEEQNNTDFIDILSNGFKIRQSSAGNWNNSGDVYVYIAFAESPFKYANAR